MPEEPAIHARQAATGLSGIQASFLYHRPGCPASDGLSALRGKLRPMSYLSVRASTARIP